MNDPLNVAQGVIISDIPEARPGMCHITIRGCSEDESLIVRMDRSVQFTLGRTDGTRGCSMVDKNPPRALRVSPWGRILPSGPRFGSVLELLSFCPRLVSTGSA